MRRLAMLAWLSTLKLAVAAPLFGGYVWGGYLAPSRTVASFYDSVRLCLSHGISLIRFDVGDFPGKEAYCRSTNTLACYARIQFDDPVWDDKGLKAVMLTAIDRSCSGIDSARCFEPSWLAAHSAVVIDEYLELFRALYERFGTRKIQFILSNWEADNAINCGDAFDFVRNRDGFAARCNGKYPIEVATPSLRAAGLLRWVALRDQAIDRFRATHPTFDLVQAPEFNVYKGFASGCGGQCDGKTAAVIDQIAIAGGRQYCSYSSYESQGPRYLDDTRDLGRICRHLIIGEFGLDLDSFTPQAARDNFRRVAEAAQPLYAIVPWNAVDEGHGARYGLFDNEGEPDQLKLIGPLAHLLVPKP